MKKLVLLLSLLTTPVLVSGQTLLPSLFSDHMVLQQKSLTPFWGEDTPGQTVTIRSSWGQSVSTQANSSGAWRVKLSTPEAGGPYSITVNGSSAVSLDDVMVGEVWLAAGQSNMEMPIRGFKNQPVDNSMPAILNSSGSKVRMFTVARQVSLTPKQDVKGLWQKAGPSTTGGFSATAYFFANQLAQSLDVPVGVISTSWGGSKIEAWMDKETLKQFSQVSIPSHIPAKDKRPKDFRVQQLPTVLYNGMLNPLVGYGIKGAIWYQGESNRNNFSDYPQLMLEMVEHWRNSWQLGEFPFYYAQIAPFNYWDTNSALIREAQLKAQAMIPNSGMSVNLDTNQCTHIHPSNKRVAGERLAYWALNQEYGLSAIEFSGPFYQSHEVQGEQLSLKLSGAPNGIFSKAKEITGFEIAGEDRKFYPAKAKIEKLKPQITLTSEMVKDPVAARYAFSNCPEFSIFSTAGLPLSSFRTDNWPVQ